MSQFRLLTAGGSIESMSSGSTTPFLRAAPAPKSRWRAKSESLRRLCRAECKGRASAITFSSRIAVRVEFSRSKAAERVKVDTADALRLGVFVWEDGEERACSAGVDGGGTGPGGDSENADRLSRPPFMPT